MLTLPRMRLSIVASLALLAGSLAGCQQADVGQDCTFAQNIKGPVPGDFFATGITSCDNLICIKSPGARLDDNGVAIGYCSKACASDSECSTSETGLKCRALTFDQNYLATLPPDQAAKFQPYLGSAAGSALYCAKPLQ